MNTFWAVHIPRFVIVVFYTSEIYLERIRKLVISAIILLVISGISFIGTSADIDSILASWL